FSHRLSLTWLVAASLFFYGWWNPQFLLLLVSSIVANYLLAIAILHLDKRAARRSAFAVLAFAVAAHVAVLGYVRYAGFLIDNVDRLFHYGHVLEVALPLGISFFTFTQIAFLVDVFRGRVERPNILRYALFVSYFPHLIAGPIIHHSEVMPQFAHGSTYRIDPAAVS